jgi:Uma2 family endonuclease
MDKATAAQRVPVLVVEYLGPDDFAGKVMRRARKYIGAGVQLLWLIDSYDKCAIVHRASGNPYVVEAGGELTGEDVIPGFRCPVNDFLFPEEATSDWCI